MQINEVPHDHIRKRSIVKRTVIAVGFVIFVATLNYFGLKTSGIVNWLLTISAGIAVIAIAKRVGLSKIDMGLSKASVRLGLLYGGIAVLVVGVTFGLIYLVQPSVFVDSRYNKTTIEVLATALVFIPFHTVLLEELIFRGAILGYLLRVRSRRLAIVWTSAIFGLWHILPSLGIAQSSRAFSNAIGASDHSQLISIASVVVATFFGSLVFSWLRLRSKSLIAPILAHWAINAIALLFAALAN